MRWLLVVALGMLLAGCGVEMVTVAATQAELQARAASAATRQLHNAEQDIGRIHLERAIATYQAEHGSYPPSLQALVPGFLESLPMKADGTAYGYDPATGKVLDQPRTGPNPADLAKIEEIRAAIHRYGTATGYYPPTLDALAPAYLTTPPRTVDGRMFIYNNQNGYIALPDQPVTPVTPLSSGAPPVAGGGPMGEVMTGIGMRNELNRMNNAGTNAAGTHSRRTLDQSVSQHNQGAEEALKWTGQ